MQSFRHSSGSCGKGIRLPASSPPLSHSPGYAPLLWPSRQVSALLGKPEEVDVAGGLGGLHPGWFDAFRQHQAFEVGRARAHVFWSPA